MAKGARITKTVFTCGLSLIASKRDRADGGRLVRAFRSGDSLKEKTTRLKQVGADISAEEAALDAERADQKQQKASDKNKRMSAPCVYLGSSEPEPGLKPGRKYIAEIDGDGLRIVEGFKPKSVIPWATVEAVEVIDASRMEIKSRVEQRATGGIWALPGTMAPVSRTSSKHIARSKLALETENGDWLLEVHADAATLEGKLLLARGVR